MNSGAPSAAGVVVMMIGSARPEAAPKAMATIVSAALSQTLLVICSSLSDCLPVARQGSVFTGAYASSIARRQKTGRKRHESTGLKLGRDCFGRVVRDGGIADPCAGG